MKNVFIFFVLVSYFTDFFAQKNQYPFEKWSAAEIEKANTAKNETYLNEICKQVIFYTNLVRINPQLFADTYVKKYIDSLQLKKTEFITSLFADLKKQKSLALLLPDKKLSQIAQAFAEESGKAGKTGHGNFTTRLKGFNTAGENCSYGKETALDIVIDLLIDEGVPSLGHRENILSADYGIIGVGFSSHKKYGVCCVMDFAGKPVAEQNSKKK